ncbi:hypothetical protein MRB53_028418 [Persea americana]|uniref:Uncharacterized protein n=1 Tax=Persea americana TaxID=3435 RepID=A0ACC2KFZ5_PERAE|nr:hypothetical protein MRB53_028418 [Persea americana]
MKHHRTYHRSSSPPLEVLKQTNVVEGADNELLDYGEQEDDQIDYDLFSDLPKVTGAPREGKNGTQENFLVDKEDLVPEVVGSIPSEDVIVDNVIPSPLPSLPLLAIEQTDVADAEEEDVDDYA